MPSPVVEVRRAEARPIDGEPDAGKRPGFAIRTEGLTKRLGGVDVVDRLDLSVPAGSVFGFLGPNGSGKTTTIRMLLGLIEPTAGTATVLGRPMPDDALTVLPAIGALVEGPAWYPWLTGRQNLLRMDAAGPARGRSDRTAHIDTALQRVGLTAAAHKKYRAYSLGMRQRLGLANALVRPRELLILDEPTNGMDPQGTREIRHLIRDIAAEGTTVFLSSHLLSEIAQICTHAAVMNLGRIVAQGSLEELQAATVSQVRVDTDDVTLAADTLRRCGLSPVTGDRTVTADFDGRPPEELCRVLVEARVRVAGFVVERPSLEDTFVALTGEGFDVAR
ncbi:MAG: type transport system ATP-binding protein [Actinomycetota bacterium]|jgi:ABC-2 type transport system ATP-binding protein|nr:type transport system ATP-binding protein [Actinomycetota bacterium]